MPGSEGEPAAWSGDAHAFASRFLAALLQDSHTFVRGVGVVPWDPDAVREPWRENPQTRVRDALAGLAQGGVSRGSASTQSVPGSGSRR